MATMPCSTPSSSRMRRCSSVCGIHPSVAATTSSATSTAPTPASMFLMKRTWPGTSTKPISTPDGRVANANPRSMVRPARLLLGEAVGVGAGEREHERRLAVVDVTGGRDRAHGLGVGRRRREPSTAASDATRWASSVGSTVRRSHTTAPSLDPGDHAPLAEPRHRVVGIGDRHRNADRRDRQSGERAAAGDGFGVDHRAPGTDADDTRSARTRSSSTESVAMRHSGSCGGAARRGTRAPRVASTPSVTLSARTARASGCRAHAATEVGAADDDAGLRAAEQLVARERHQRGAARRSPDGSRARRGATADARRATGVVSSTARNRRRPSPAVRATTNSAIDVASVNPIMR